LRQWGKIFELKPTRFCRQKAAQRRHDRFMPKQKPATREAILKRIKEIDAKFQSTEPWLHSTLWKLARERELLVEQANAQFKAGLKHEWR
jgi:hypothetical protein